MKKNLFCLAALCAAALVSCTPKELAIDEPKGGEEKTDAAELVHVTINASMDEATKAYIDDADGFAWKWAEGDELAVFDASNSKIVFTINSTTVGSAVAKFEAGVPATFVPVKAVFPASAAGATPDEFSIKPAQSPSTYSIDPAAMVATADGEKVSDTEFNFYFDPAVSYFRFAVAAGVKKVILHTVGKDDTIAGESRSVTVNLPNTDGGKFWAAVNPAVYHGIRAFAYDGTSYAKKGADAAEIDLSAKGSGKNIGTVSGGTAVSVIENADNLISYLGNPALDGYIVNDLDLTGKTINSCASFANIFDGQYHSINNWTSDKVSMFANVTGTVKNFTIENTCSFIAPMGGNFAPAVTLLSGGTVSGVTNEAPITADGTITAQRSLAGVVARMEVNTSIVEDCHNKGNISSNFVIGETKATQYIGGVVGVFIAPTTKLRINACTNEGAIIISGEDPNTNFRNTYVGGIVGTTGLKSGSETSPSGYSSNYGIIRDCHNKGAVSVTWGGGTGGYFNIGGIIGYGECVLENCTNNSPVSLINSTTKTNARPAIGGLAGGLAGNATTNAIDCVNYGDISLNGMFTNASASGAYGTGGGGTIWASCGGCFGIVGDNSNMISNCDNYGKVTINTLTGSSATSAHSYGGIVGRTMANVDGCDNYAEEMSVTDIVYTCHIGGIAGYSQADITNCELKAKLSVTNDCSSLTGTATINKVETVVKTATVLNCGGIVGYSADGSNITTCNNTADSIELIDVTSHVRFGGIVGMHYSGLTDCTNSADLRATRKYAENTMLNFCGGNIGYLYLADAIITGCTNTGDISYTADQSSEGLDVGGNVGASKFACTVEGCSNSGAITVDGQNATCQALIGGVMGSTKVKNCTVKDCNNTGALNLTKVKSTNFSYLGGIWGHYTSSGNKLDNCNTISTITSDAASKVRVGGLAGAFYGSVSNCDAESTITVTNALAGSRVAGYMGYSSSSITGGSVSGTINASAAGASHAGLLFGDCARTYTLAGITVDGSLTTNSNFSSGLLFGGYNSADNGMVYTLGTVTSPFIIKKSASVNGVSPTIVPSTIGEVMGDTTTNAPASPSITFTNVVLAD